MRNRGQPVGLLRHPPVEGAAGLCYGRLDLPLAAGWQAQLERQLPRLRVLAPRVILSSPQPRCRHAADWLAAALDLAVHPDDRLRELDFGAWEGQLWQAVARADLDRWAADPGGFHPPGGESGDGLLRRVAAVAREIAARPERCLVVSHGGPLRLLPALLRGEPPRLLAAAPPPGRLGITRCR